MWIDIFGRIGRLGGFVVLLGVTANCTTLHGHIRDGDPAGVARALGSGADPNHIAPTGGTSEENYKTPLFLAIGQHDLEIVKLLVEAGADVNLPSTCGGAVLTPLMKAAVHGDLAIVRYLLEKRADPMLTPGDTDILQWLVLRQDRATDPERRAIARTVVRHLRTTAGNRATQGFLDTQTSNGWTPLGLAIWKGDRVMIDLLLREGAAINALTRVNSDLIGGVASDEWPPIFFAMLREREDIAQLLIQAGASLDDRTANGTSLSEVRARVAEYRRERAEAEAEMAELRRQNELEEREERRRAGLAFYQEFVRQATGGADPSDPRGQRSGGRSAASNPVDDNAFYDRMRAINQAEVERRRRNAEQQGGVKRARTAARSADGEDDERRAPASAEAPDDERQARERAEAERKESERQARERAEAERKESERQARERAEAQRKESERQARERAEAERKERWRRYLAAVRDGIQLHAVKGPRCDDGQYCVVATWPVGVRWQGDGEGGLVDVDFRARCKGSTTFSTGTLWRFTDNHGAYISPTISPKPNCPASNVQVEVTAVRGSN